MFKRKIPEIGVDKLVNYPTHISPAHWCTMATGEAKYEPASMQLPRIKAPQTVAWLDRLLDGGIRLPPPGYKGQPITLLISGPPGSGKTTLAVELCKSLTTLKAAGDRVGMTCLYLSSDQDTRRLIENANDLLGAGDEFIPYDKRETGARASVLVCGRDLIKAPALKKLAEAGLPLVLPFMEVALVAFHNHPAIVALHREGAADHDPLKHPSLGFVPSGGPDILVVDGLNSVGRTGQAELYARFLKAASNGVRLLVFILDSSPDGEAHWPWEYACDLAFNIDYGVTQDYFVRTFQITKARYQGHVWGVHQIKPYRPPQPPDPLGPKPSDDEKDELYANMRRGHPYRDTGGTLIYPSIHYYLSLYKRMGSAQNPALAKTVPKELSDWLGDGVPVGRCTAFIGTRGGHKSHLAYVHLLSRIISHQESGIVVSLRDDEAMTKHTMTQILIHELKCISGDTDSELELNAKNMIRKLEKDDRLEVLYYHPGYITPEEFMHRLFVSLHRVKSTIRKTSGRPKAVTVLFNSLDQLASRFPLCARQAIFVPGMIEMLTGEDVTSIFIAVDEPGQPPEQYGLLPMADLILSFNPHRFKGFDYFNILKAAGRFQNPGEEDKWSNELKGAFREEVVVQVVRFSGGQRAGMRGILELADKQRLESRKSVFGQRGLHFVPIYDKYEYLESHIHGPAARASGAD